LSPILLELGPITLRWYGLLFSSGLVLSYMYAVKLFKQKNFKIEHLDSLVVYIFLGVVLGARFGHVVFYNPSYFFSNPLEIFKLWNGGLASHGAAIGVLLAYFLWTKKNNVKFTKYIDYIALTTPIAAVFIRTGNFFNSEIVGKFTGFDYGVVFAKLGETMPRHPSQLYEALLNLLIFVLFFWLYKKDSNRRPLFFTSIYFILYFGGRFILEFWKDLHALPEGFPLSMGQVLSFVPMIIGFVLFYSFRNKKVK